MAIRFYPAVISKDSGSDYSVSFPDFPGCVSAGHTLDEALFMGQEALAAHLAWMQADGDAIPEPSSVDAARASVDRGDRDSVVTIQLMAGAVRGRATRLSVTIDEDLVQRIDAVAGHYGRSGWLAEAAREKLASLRGEAMSPSSKRPSKGLAEGAQKFRTQRKAKRS